MNNKKMWWQHIFIAPLYVLSFMELYSLKQKNKKTMTNCTTDLKGKILLKQSNNYAETFWSNKYIFTILHKDNIDKMKRGRK